MLVSFQPNQMPHFATATPPPPTLCSHSVGSEGQMDLPPTHLSYHLTNLPGFHNPVRRNRNALMQHSQTHFCHINELINQGGIQTFRNRRMDLFNYISIAYCTLDQWCAWIPTDKAVNIQKIHCVHRISCCFFFLTWIHE